MLMVAVGFGVFIGSLAEANYSVPYTLGALFEACSSPSSSISCSHIRAVS